METTLISETEREKLRRDIVAICDENDRAMGLPKETSTPLAPSQPFPTWVIAFIAASVGFALGVATVALM